MATGGGRRRLAWSSTSDAVLLDAAGLVLLARAETRSAASAARYAAVPALPAHVRRALHLTGLALVPVFPDGGGDGHACPGRGRRRRRHHARSDAIRALHPGTPLTSTPPARSELMITTTEVYDGDHTVVHPSGC